MRFLEAIITTILLSVSISGLSGNSNKIYEVSTIEGKVPIIDGKLEKSVWHNIPWEKNFTQHVPHEGERPTQKTAFKILHDENYLYVAIRAYDTEPDEIVKRLSRRDNLEGDFVTIQIDSYNDKRTAFVFSVTAAGVKEDMIISDDGNSNNNNWNPIWHVETQIDDKGWIAEMQIPLSQIRFSELKKTKESQRWGLQVGRMIYRKEEIDFWKHVPQDVQGWVSSFGDLRGLRNIKPKKERSLTPYMTGIAESFNTDSDNPFTNGKDQNLNVGLNGKFGVTNNLTMDFAINPDFGQVEADPSQVNLSAYESYFEEKRPFFIDGSNIMNFSLTQLDGHQSAENLFYSRRIGRNPHHNPETEDDEFVDKPENTSILGAFKLSGKTKKGWSVGIMESMTSRERAEISNGENNYFETVEPTTNYFLSRVKKDFNEGETVLGGMLTATNRNIQSENLNYLHDQAYTGGIDFSHRWKDKTYSMDFKGYFSHVKGNSESILNTQRSSARYFQRPDVSHINLDSSLTSLSGYGGAFSIGKTGQGHIRYAAFFNWKSPGLEVNDMGFMRDADQIMQVTWIQYREWEPGAIFRNYSINFNQWTGWDFGGNNLFKGGNISLNAQLNNYWRFGIGINPQSRSLSQTALRGGPFLKNPPRISYGWWLNTDKRKKISFNFGNSQAWSKYQHNHKVSFWSGITYKPNNTIDISINPRISINESNLQYVDNTEFNNHQRYLMALLKQTTVSMSMRLNLSLSPNLTIQYWGQPFIATGEYSHFKRITNSTADKYDNRFHEFSQNEISYNQEDGTYNFDENKDGFYDYSVNNPNFNVLQFRSNLVARWEYKPGSTIFLVWTQNRDDYHDTGNLTLKKDLNNMFSVYPHNTFLIKLTYRLGV
jgi:hypothetical protein